MDQNGRSGPPSEYGIQEPLATDRMGGLAALGERQVDQNFLSPSTPGIDWFPKAIAVNTSGNQTIERDPAPEYWLLILNLDLIVTANGLVTITQPGMSDSPIEVEVSTARPCIAVVIPGKGRRIRLACDSNCKITGTAIAVSGYGPMALGVR